MKIVDIKNPYKRSKSSYLYLEAYLFATAEIHIL